MEQYADWIAEALMLEVPREVITRYLVEQGASYQEINECITAIESNPLLRIGQRLGHQLNKRDWLLHLYQKLYQAMPQYAQVERRSQLSQDEFYRIYFFGNRPVVITDAMSDCPVLNLWTPAYLRERYGHISVQIDANRNTGGRSSNWVPFSQFLDYIENTQEGNDWYMTGYNRDANLEPLQDLFAEYQHYPHYLDPNHEDKVPYLFIGSNHTSTWLHFDAGHGLFCQLYGQKQISLIAPFFLPFMYHHRDFFSKVDLNCPDYEEFPLFNLVTVQQVTLNPGEMLYVPVGWYHFVKTLSPSINTVFHNFLYLDGIPSLNELYYQTTYTTPV